MLRRRYALGSSNLAFFFANWVKSGTPPYFLREGGEQLDPLKISQGFLRDNIDNRGSDRSTKADGKCEVKGQVDEMWDRVQLCHLAVQS